MSENENKDSIIKEAYNRFLKNPWPYYGGAVILGLLNVALLASSGKGWGICGGLFYTGAMIFDLCGGEPEKWDFFAKNAKHLALLNKGFR